MNRAIRKYAVVIVAAMVFDCVALGQQPPKQATQQPANAPSPPATGTDKPAVKRIRADLAGFELDPSKKPVSTSMQIGAGSRGGALPPVLYAPHLGKAFSLHPTFYWSGGSGTGRYAFRLYNGDDDVVYEADVGGNNFVYPANAPALKPGEIYSWTIRPKSGALSEPAEAVSFRLIGGDERQAVQQALQRFSSDKLDESARRAEIFLDHRLWYDVVEAYTQLIHANPARADLLNQRAAIYDQLAETGELAQQDRSRAAALAPQH